MVLDRRAVAVAGVEREPAESGARGGGGAARQALRDPENLVDRPLDPDMALDEGLAQLVQIGGNEVSERRQLRNGDRHRGRCGQIEVAPVPKHQPQGNGSGGADLINDPLKAALEEHG